MMCDSIQNIIEHGQQCCSCRDKLTKAFKVREYTVTKMSFEKKDRYILLQNSDEPPCFLIDLCNFWILSNVLIITKEDISTISLDMLIEICVAHILLENSTTDAMKIKDALCKLADPISVEITSFQNFRHLKLVVEELPFELPLLMHGWIVDPLSQEASVIGSRSHDELVKYSASLAQDNPDKELIDKFLALNGHLTEAGISAINCPESISSLYFQPGVFMLFMEGNFRLMYKRGSRKRKKSNLYILKNSKDTWDGKIAWDVLTEIEPDTSKGTKYKERSGCTVNFEKPLLKSRKRKTAPISHDSIDDSKDSWVKQPPDDLIASYLKKCLKYAEKLKLNSKEVLRTAKRKKLAGPKPSKSMPKRTNKNTSQTGAKQEPKNIVSLNVKNLRRIARSVILKQRFEEFIKRHDFDAICLQEVHCKAASFSEICRLCEQEDPDVHDLLNSGIFASYETYWSIKTTRRESGVCVLVKKSCIQPESVMCQFPLHQKEPDGRIIVLEFPTYFLANIYAPNGGHWDERMKPDQLILRRKTRTEFFKKFRRFTIDASALKSVIWVGDFNVRVGTNVNETISGLREEQILGYEDLIISNMLDAYLIFNYDECMRDTSSKSPAYTFFNRSRTSTFRIDYIFVTCEMLCEMLTQIVDCIRHDDETDLFGGDHLAVSIQLK